MTKGEAPPLPSRKIQTETYPAIRHGRFDLIWLPPPSFAGAHSAGYNPKEYFNLSNSYGDAAQHLSMLRSPLGNGVEPVADEFQEAPLKATLPIPVYRERRHMASANSPSTHPRLGPTVRFCGNGATTI